MVTQYGFYHNTNECIGCKCCVVACKDKNDLPVGEKYRRIYDYSGGTWNVGADGVTTVSDYFTYSLSVACNHCVAPACVASCPVEAITKREDGIVSIDKTICIGCGACATACPYAAPYVSSATGVARKCDLCKDLIDKDEKPVCVISCPMRCLEFGELEDLRSKYGSVDNVAPLPTDSGTGPSLVLTRHRLNPDGALQGRIINAPEEIESATV
jgi:anaerobic dimethyl sulfoxide reductase subunit B (iron-sulfur subunit)